LGHVQGLCLSPRGLTGGDLRVLGARYDVDGSIGTAENEKMMLKIGDLRPKRLFGEGDPLNTGGFSAFS